jgi:hypothetical protein
LTDTGPDIFISRKNDHTPIKPDEWGNWDSYHDEGLQGREARESYRGFWNADRKNRRYDPYTRKYVKWENDHNHQDDPTRGMPLYTRDEHWRFAARGWPTKKKEWTSAGPKVCYRDTRWNIYPTSLTIYSASARNMTSTGVPHIVLR